ncbi:hypothetical protein CANCADRAFT_45303 [Tortispora caseinolytica NRRL Y-17796]|uniref:C3HC-type domain-containing protein n=1 Tax=Tortispora caseinolytica NRRL Y-17796 TaxID=767744 RepID=A0A1E4TAN5_9ASCO|nr:hypothetical protein CANCADRAFT_45303 [Tortispora caseinolytica NRRL Y-17796]
MAKRSISDLVNSYLGESPKASKDLADRFSRMQALRRKLTHDHPHTASASLSMDHTDPPSPRSKTNYAPWDRTALLHRLSSFKFVRWPFDELKYPRLAAPEWAKAGWICTGPCTVTCSLCTKSHVLRLTDEPDVDVALCGKYAKLINDHYPNCLWAKRRSSDSTYTVSFSDPDQALTDYFLRAKSFSSLSLANLTVLDPEHTTTSTPERTLALFGWQARPSFGGRHVAYCDMCFRTVSLEGEFDALHNHRAYCPWIAGSLPAYKVLSSLCKCRKNMVIDGI